MLTLNSDAAKGAGDGNTLPDEGAQPARGRRHRGCHVARWRHPFRQATFIVTVATLATVSPTSPPSPSSASLPRRCCCTTQLSHPPGSYADVSRAPPSADVSAAARRSSAARALLAAFAAAASLSARHVCLGSLGACHRSSLSLPGSAPSCRVGTSPPRLPRPPPSAERYCTCCAFSPCPRSQVRVSNRSGGPGPPLFSVFCFSTRPPARHPEAARPPTDREIKNARPVK